MFGKTDMWGVCDKASTRKQGLGKPFRVLTSQEEHATWLAHLDSKLYMCMINSMWQVIG